MPLYTPPSGQPPRPYVSMGVPPKPEPAPIKKIVLPWRSCDECGYSEVDNQPIARAVWQVEVPGGTLYFCDHHYKTHEFTFVESNYAVYNISEKVASQ